jgi:hypothetical protein
VLCTATTKAGAPCRAQALPASDRCLLHSEDPAIQADRQEAQRRGGLARARQLTLPSADPLDVADLDLESIHGLRTYLARAMVRLAELPFDVKVANAIGQVVQVQRVLIEATELEGRVADLEAKVWARRAA